jgi:hypothetical protein
VTKPKKRGAPVAAPSAAAIRKTEITMRTFTIATIALFGFYWAYVVFAFHHIGNYGVETDFYWKYGPAAAALKQGRVLIEHFDSKGWGYPLVVAAVSFLGLDLFKAGQLIGVLSGCVVAWCAFRVHRRLLGATLGFLSILLLIGNPTFLVNVYEVGTDMFFFALVAASIALMLGCERPGWIAIGASGLVAGWAFSTRYNGLFLWPGAVLTILFLLDRERPFQARLKRAALWSAGFLLAAAPWLMVNAAHTGNPLTNNNYTNVGYAVYGEGNWEQFFYGGDRKIHSFADVVRLDPARFMKAMVANTFDHVKRDLFELNPQPWGILAAAGLLVVALTRRSRRWGAYLLFGLLYFLTLVPVFYGARFSLPMVLFYAALALAAFSWDRLSAWVAPIERRFPVRIFVFLLIWMPGALAAHSRTQDPRNSETVQAGPYETMEAADYLKAHGTGATLLARKPHVAFLSGMTFAPIPQVDSPAALHREALRARARYLLVSGAELSLRAGVRPFAEPDARVPGFRRVFESQGALVYEVLPDSAAAPAP